MGLKRDTETSHNEIAYSFLYFKNTFKKIKILFILN